MEAGKLDVFCSVMMRRRAVRLGGSGLMKVGRRILPRAAAARVGAKDQRSGGGLAAPPVAEPCLCVCARLLPSLSRPQCGHVSGSREVFLQLQEGLSDHRTKQILQALHQPGRSAEQHHAGKRGGNQAKPVLRDRKAVETGLSGVCPPAGL